MEGSKAAEVRQGEAELPSLCRHEVRGIILQQGTFRTQFRKWFTIDHRS